ncbi:MAG: TraR/DksA family transcriptional regulator [Gammaproteobacteria bacterium]|nr:TraR/DksA family transcriptional regulator [Gammaproteobacteria bacterium]
MNNDDIERIKAQLLYLQGALYKQEEDFKEASQPVELDQAKVGRLSRMDAMQAHEMALEASRRRKAQLLRVGGAMRRIELGGYCLSCEEEIDIRRLEFDPTSTHCIQCAEKLE